MAISSMISQAPFYLTCFLGILLGAVLGQRSAIAGLLLIGGALWMLVFGLAWPFVFSAVIQQVGPDSPAFIVMRVIGSLSESFGTLLIMSAALVGRRPVPYPHDDNGPR